MHKRVDHWSKWLTKRSLPTWGKVIVVDLGSDVITWRPIEPRSLEPNEKVCTAYVYLQRRYGLPSTEALAGKVVESAFMAFSPKEEWEAAGYEVRHKSEEAFRMACMFELGWVLKELELRTAASESGVKKHTLEDDLAFATTLRLGQVKGGNAREISDDRRMLFREIEIRIEAGGMLQTITRQFVREGRYSGRATSAPRPA